MKRVNLKSLLCVVVLFCSAVAVAQPQGGERPEGGERPRREREERSVEEIAQKRTDKMAEKLALSDKQKKSLYELNLSYATEMKQQAEQQRREQEELRAKREAERKAAKLKREDHMKSVMSLLNDNQKIEYAIMLSEADKQKPQQEGSQAKKDAPKGAKKGAPRRGEGTPAERDKAE